MTDTPKAESDPLKSFLFATLGRNALVVAMCACAAWACGVLAERLVAGPPAPAHTPLVLCVALLAAVDVLYVRQKNIHLGTFTKDWLLFNASRWAITIIVLKLISYAGRDLGDLPNQLTVWREEPILFFWDGRFMLSLVVVLVVWAIARTLGGDLAHLTEGERMMTIDPAFGAQTDRAQTRQALAVHTLGIGTFVALIGSLANWVARGRDMAAFPVGVDVLIYLSLGLALLGLSQLTVLRANWLWERTPIGGDMIRRWTLLGLAFIGGLALLTLLLPLSAAADLLPTVAEILRWLAAALQMIGYALYALLSILLWPLAQLFSLFRPGAVPVPPSAPFVPPPAAVPVEGEPLPLPPWFQLAQSFVFWVIILILLGYAMRHVLRQHEGLRRALSELPLVVWLRTGWQGLLRLIRGAKAEVERLWPATQPASPAAGDAPAPTDAAPDARTLPLREQLRLLYVSLLERASQHGHARRPGQTPYEFARTLTQAVPDAQGEIDQLTQQFVDARYSVHDVPRDQVSWARRVVTRIQRRL